MRFHAIHAPIHVKGRIADAIYELFHGIATRNGIVCPFYDNYWYNSDPENPVSVYRVQRTPSGVGTVEVRGADMRILHPLDIQRSGWRIPDVTMPIGNIVVSERVKNALDGLPNIGFLPVRFVKLFHYEFHVGDFRHWDDPRFTEFEDIDRREEEFFERLPAVLAYHRSVGPHYEVLIPSPKRLKERYPQAEYRSVIERPYDKRAGGVVCPQMLEENAIVWAGRGYFMSNQTFSLLEAFFDWDFFEHKEAEV